MKEILPLFPECEAEIQKLFSPRNDEDYAESDKDMYYDILDSSFSSKLVDLDVYLHIYYIFSESFFPVTARIIKPSQITKGKMMLKNATTMKITFATQISHLDLLFLNPDIIVGKKKINPSRRTNAAATIPVA